MSLSDQLQRAIQYSPCCPNFLKSSIICTPADSYGLEMESLSIECSLAKSTLLRKNMDSIVDVILELSLLRIAFPLLTKLLQIALTIVVSTAHCECSFSALSRSRPTYVRQ